MPLCFISQQLVKLVMGAQLSWLSWAPNSVGCPAWLLSSLVVV